MQIRSHILIAYIVIMGIKKPTQLYRFFVILFRMYITLQSRQIVHFLLAPQNHRTF